MKSKPKRLLRLATAARGKSDDTSTESTLLDQAAYHESAHAVVAVRVGFTLTKLDIKQRLVQGPNGAPALSAGYTEIDVSSLIGADDTEVLLRRMLYAAAPVSVELDFGNDVADACAGDFASLCGYLTRLELPKSQAADLFSWAASAADSILRYDGGDALDAVAAELRERRSLRPSHVVGLIRDSDALRARRTAVAAEL